jgi:glutamate-1-semialdehyde 2,1-aminomutase
VLNFRQAYAGAAQRLGVRPDLMTFGKIIGGGLPIGAVGGSRAIMEVFSARNGNPAVPQGGTFSANPLSMSAGIAAMRALTHDTFAELESLGDYARNGLARIFHNKFAITGQASLLRIHARPVVPRSYREALPTAAEQAALGHLSERLLERGFFVPPAGTWCLSTPMTRRHIDELLAACADINTGLQQS